MAALPTQRMRVSIGAHEVREFERSTSLAGETCSVALRPLGERAAGHRPASLQQYALFSNMLPRESDEIVAAARGRELTRGQAIHIEGDVVRQVVLLISGSAKVVQFGRSGTEVILRLCGSGELVGTLGLSTQGRHSATARALQPCRAVIWDIRVFDTLSRRFPLLRLNTALILAKQLGDMEDRFREIATCRAAVRLGRQIVRLMDQVGHRNHESVEISISREELAQLIGTTVFTVSRLLADWDRRGIVVARRETVSVQDLKGLEDVSRE